MRLQAQAPARMIETIVKRGLKCSGSRRAVHGLQKEMAEGERLECARVGTRLRIDELQLVAASLFEPRAGLGTDADPVETARGAGWCRWFRRQFRIRARAERR